MNCELASHLLWPDRPRWLIRFVPVTSHPWQIRTQNGKCAGCPPLFLKLNIRKDKVFIFHNYSGSHTIDLIRGTAEGTNQLAESKIGKVIWKGLRDLKQKTSHFVREQKEGASKTTNLLLILHNLLYWGCPNRPTSIEYTHLLCLFAVARLVLHPGSKASDLLWREALQPCSSLLFEVKIRRFQGDSSSCPGFHQHTHPDFNTLNIRGNSNQHLWNKTDVLSALEKEVLWHETPSICIIWLFLNGL